MSQDISGRTWRAGVILLLVITLLGGAAALWRYNPGKPVEIFNAAEENRTGTIYIGGAVNIPGYYPYSHEDSLESLIRAAGGLLPGADSHEIELVFHEAEDEPLPQKININRAEAWLLKALPDIGETLAGRIVEYRTGHGLFRNTMELLKVEGIGTAIYEKVEKYITVED